MIIPRARNSSSTEKSGKVTAKLTRLTSSLKLELSVPDSENRMVLRSERVDGIGDLLSQFMSARRTNEFKGANYRSVLNLLGNGV